MGTLVEGSGIVWDYQEEGGRYRYWTGSDGLPEPGELMELAEHLELRESSAPVQTEPVPPAEPHGCQVLFGSVHAQVQPRNWFRTHLVQLVPVPQSEPEPAFL